MRKGFTTGSCAAAAAKAATMMLFSHSPKEKIEIMTPAGIMYSPDVEAIEFGDGFVKCGIRKDGGDDIDVTSGLLICAKVSFDMELKPKQVVITGGEGVGIVRKKGLENPVGEYAINSVPRQMIEREVSEVLAFYDAPCGAEAHIFVPGGKECAEKTFNSRMGIEGGISILGTSGIVEPMSVDAILKTIELDLKVKHSEGSETAILVPGNYGETFLKNNYDIPSSRIVMFSNYVGAAIDYAVDIGFKKILIVGHTGKLVKVSGGIMNTHSKEADCRMELMLSATILAAKKRGIELREDIFEEILSQVTTTACLEILEKENLIYDVSQIILEKILFYLKKRAGNSIQIECILYENSFGLLAKSEGAEALL